MDIKTLGLISTIFLVIALFGVQFIWGPDPTKTFSRLVAKKTSSIIYYGITFSIFLPLFSTFVIGWFVPHFDLPTWFNLIFYVGIAAQFACIFIPEIKGRQAQLHVIAAGIMSACVLAQTASLLILIELNTWLLLAVAFSTVVMSLSWLVYLLKLQITKHELAIQSSYFACYLLTMMLVTHWA